MFFFFVNFKPQSNQIVFEQFEIENKTNSTNLNSRHFERVGLKIIFHRKNTYYEVYLV